MRYGEFLGGWDLLTEPLFIGGRVRVGLLHGLRTIRATLGVIVLFVQNLALCPEKGRLFKDLPDLARAKNATRGKPHWTRRSA
jgi:hypothetical protein